MEMKECDNLIIFIPYNSVPYYQLFPLVLIAFLISLWASLWMVDIDMKNQR